MLDIAVVCYLRRIIRVCLHVS